MPLGELARLLQWKGVAACSCNGYVLVDASAQASAEALLRQPAQSPAASKWPAAVAAFSAARLSSTPSNCQRVPDALIGISGIRTGRARSVSPAFPAQARKEKQFQVVFSAASRKSLRKARKVSLIADGANPCGHEAGRFLAWDGPGEALGKRPCNCNRQHSTERPPTNTTRALCVGQISPDSVSSVDICSAASHRGMPRHSGSASASSSRKGLHRPRLPRDQPVTA